MAELISVLRKDVAEEQALLTALASAARRRRAGRLGGLFAGTGARPVDLPSYAFQHQRYWPHPSWGTNVSATGLDATGHPLLSAAVDLADDGLVLTGRLSLQTHPWLADHVVLGTVLMPGTALLELADRAGDEAGCGRVEELILAAPLVLPEQGSVRLQVRVGPADESGLRALGICSRIDGVADGMEHAAGTLAPGESPAGFDVSAWPPAGTTPVDLTGIYDKIAEGGFAYGPVFQGLRAAWRRGDEVFAEVALPDEVDGAGFGVHPALLDAALHVTAFNGMATRLMPFSWTGVCVHASGASAARVRITRLGDDAVAVAVADVTDAPLASVEKLVLRPVADELGAIGRDSLFGLEWVPVPVGEPGPVVVVVGLGAGMVDGPAELCPDLASVPGVPATVVVPVAGSGAVVESVHGVTARVLGLVRGVAGGGAVRGVAAGAGDAGGGER